MEAKLNSMEAESRLLSSLHVPAFFRLANKADSERLEKLINITPGIHVFDQLHGQLEELVKLQSPRRKFSKEELSAAAKAHLKNTPAHEYGVWVYYPWSLRLVHILDEKEFVEVRTSRNQYKITPEEKEILSKKKIGVIGLSVGQSVAVTMAMERIFGELRLTDFDILELSNYNRIRTGLHNLGVSKVISVAREIAEFDPFLKVVCYTEGATEENIDDFFLKGGKLDLVLEECDGLAVKILARQKAKELRIPVVMETSDRGMVDVERFDIEPDRPILHGLIDHLDINKVKEAKTNEEKIPFLLPMVGIETISTRLKASMVEVEQTITTWPQLASAVAIGGGLATDVSRRVLLNQFHDSGRYFVDVEELISDKTSSTEEEKPLEIRASLTDEEMLALINKWGITETKGQLDLDKQKVKDIVHYACMAPSGANSQSWKWMWHNKTLYLFLDGIYTAGLLDCGNTTSLVGLGAAVENLVIKTHEMGFEVIVEKNDLNMDSVLVAAIKFFDQAAAAPGLEPHVCDDLVTAIPNRLTNRNISRRVKIPREKLEALRHITRTIKGADLLLIDEPDKLAHLGEIIAKMDRIRIMHPGGHRDYRAEIRWTKEEVDAAKNGIDLLGTVDLTPSELAGFRIVRSWNVIKLLNDWGLGTGLERMGRKTIQGASALGFVTMPNFTSDDFFEGGRALERVWLAATKDNIAVHPASIASLVFNTLLHGNPDVFSGNMKKEVEELRKEFSSLFQLKDGLGEVLLLRFFIAGSPKARAVRYPLEQVLHFSK
jgi:molybdopterin/thiamine biosynthesis adenylyltransferase